MRHKLLSALSVVLLLAVGCSSSTQPTYYTHTCRAWADTVARSDAGFVSDLALDSTRAYTYRTQNVRMDSLVETLCEHGHDVAAGYYALDYRCMDPRGPLPVVVLTMPDSSMLRIGFTQGASGRLDCAGREIIYGIPQ